MALTGTSSVTCCRPKPPRRGAVLRPSWLNFPIWISRSVLPRAKAKLIHATKSLVLLLSGSCLCIGACAQQTVFNVPSGDVLDRGKVYGELDITYKPTANSASFTPRIVIGIGHRIEAGLNVSGFGVPGSIQTTAAPTVKWKVYDGGRNGWALLLGDDIVLPVQNRTYSAGNYIYAEFTKTWKTQTRATFGTFDFTRHVVAAGNCAGGQFAVEQPLGKRVSVASDWFTGHHALGYVTPGMILKLTHQLTGYLTYQIGNSGVLTGNHQALIEIGWNFN